ncbi:hypothetical protein AVEN_240197-1 [Araneus ventricosus]|uniref:Uncharacterized protein n=1 Tax=Araneus ventricosus TaxID=182803 RepID=A0A4Y2MWU8_ARAVE|nr:hypothetical protein AVEN_240197-1 [Araneus ventricosus]
MSKSHLLGCLDLVLSVGPPISSLATFQSHQSSVYCWFKSGSNLTWTSNLPVFSGQAAPCIVNAPQPGMSGKVIHGDIKSGPISGLSKRTQIVSLIDITQIQLNGRKPPNIIPLPSSETSELPAGSGLLFISHKSRLNKSILQ